MYYKMFFVFCLYYISSKKYILWSILGGVESRWIINKLLQGYIDLDVNIGNSSFFILFRKKWDFDIQLTEELFK